MFFYLRSRIEYNWVNLTNDDTNASFSVSKEKCPQIFIE